MSNYIHYIVGCITVKSLTEGAPNHKLKWFLCRLAVASAQSIEARYQVENEDVVGAAPIGDAPTTSEWSTILLPSRVRLILEVWRYLYCDVIRWPLQWSNACDVPFFYLLYLVLIFLSCDVFVFSLLLYIVGNDKNKDYQSIGHL